jgi:hypothetical protein
MLADPLLIRRPLMDVDGQCRAGFDPEAVDRWIGLGTLLRASIEACAQDEAGACAPPGT